MEPHGAIILARGKDQAVLEWHHDIPTRYFATYEELEEAFRRRVRGLVPRYHAGTRVFWDDFQQLYERPLTTGGETCEAYITSNPRDCLAFGTPFQVLQGAWLSARGALDGPWPGRPNGGAGPGGGALQSV